MQNAARPAPSLTPQCQFGVTVFADGTMADLKTGEFSVEQSEEIALRLILLASGIRNAARRASAADQGGFSHAEI